MWAVSVPFGAFTFKYYAFQSKGPYLPQALKSYAVYLPAQLLATALLFAFVRLFTSWLGETILPITIGERAISPIVLIAQFCTIFFTTIVSYLGHKYFTFRPQVTSSERHDS